MGALLVPTMVTAKTTKRGERSPKKQVKAAPAPRAASASGRKASIKRGPTAKRTAKRVAKSTRPGRNKRIAARSVRAKRVAKADRPERHARHGLRGTVDEHLHLRKGDTVENILAARGVGITEAREWVAATGGVFDLSKIRPRHGLTLRFDRETHVLESLHYEVDQRKMLVVERRADDVTARLEDLPYFVEVKGIAGSIRHGLREDTVAAGVPARIAADLADIFGWDVDVENGLVAGDAFRVIYENIWQVGMTAPQAGKVLAAELVVGGTTRTAVLFEDADGYGGYYAPTGEAVSRTFMRYPVEFTEITSQFSLDRFHPIRKQRRPHWGVDLAAPQGTPVRAAANGVVTVSGWESGLGKTVRIGHLSDIVSTYGHLSAVAPAVVVGAQVERGQVIGYVGSTGLSTGPHLHYELTRYGAHVDPLEFTCDREPAVAPYLAKQFERSKRDVARQLAAIPTTRTPTSLAMSTRLTQSAE
jgi:murein DD-endopeptidase MepM/ murein hydrolase activator NlpD